MVVYKAHGAGDSAWALAEGGSIDFLSGGWPGSLRIG